MYVENNILKVSIDNTANEPVEVTIQSLLGSVEKTQKLDSDAEPKSTRRIELDISELRDGVYNISVKSGDNITSGKFIK